MELLDALINRFIIARTADGRAPQTIHDYRRVLEPFTQWCSDDLHITSLDGLTARPSSPRSELAEVGVTRETIREYAAYLRTKGWKDGTVAIHIRNLRTFLKWVHEEGYTRENLAAAIKAPRQVTRIEIPITPEEIQLLLDTCSTDGFYDQRDRTLILLMSDTGLRTGEIINLKIGDWRSESDNSGSYLLVFAPKTSTTRYAILGHSATDAMLNYLNGRGKLSSDDMLFCSEDGAPLKKRAIGSLLMRRGARAGLERCRVHPHIFRKAFVTGALDNGMDTERVRVLAGWTTMAMFKTYTDSTLSKLRAAHQRAGPVDRMNLRVNGK